MDPKKLTRITKAVAHEKRLLIIRYLRAAHSAPVWRIAQKINLSYKSTSKHLRILEMAKLLSREQESIEGIYRLHRPIHPVVKACF